MLGSQCDNSPAVGRRYRHYPLHLIAAIENFTGWNDRCHPFTWTKSADEILPHCRPGKRTSFTRH